MSVFPIKFQNYPIFILTAIGLLLFEIVFLYFGSEIGFHKLFLFAILLAIILTLLVNPFYSMLVCLFVLFSGITQGIEIPYSFFAIVALTGLSWFINQVSQMKFSVRLDKQMLWVFGFFLSIVLSGFTAIDKLATLEMLLYFLKLFILYFLIVQIILTKTQLKAAFWVVIGSTLLSLAVGLISQLTNLPIIGQVEQGLRLRGLAGQPNVLALHLMIIIPILMLYTFKKKNLIVKIVFAFLSIFAFVGFLGTFSRSALIALIIIFIGLLYILRENRWLLFVTFFSIVALLLIVPDIIWERIQSIGEFKQDPSLRWRFILYQAAFQSFISNPLTGIGLGNFVLISHQFTNWHLIVHNTLLDVAVETGLIGLITFSGFIVSSIYYLNYSQKQFIKLKDSSLGIIYTGLLMSFLGFCVFSLFHSTHHYFILWALIGLCTSSYLNFKK